MRKRAAMRVFIPAVAFLLLTAACGGDGGETDGTDGGNGQTLESPGGIDISGVPELEDGVLSAGSCLDYPPFELVEGGDETGFDVDLTEAVAEKLGVEVEWIRVEFDRIFTAVAGGEFDVAAAAITATGPTGEERAQTVAFSDFYYNSRQSLVVNAEESPDITSTDDLGEGDIVGVQRGTTGKIWAEENLVPQGAELKTFSGAPDAFRDLEGGAITAVVNDEPSSAEIIKDLPSLELVEPIDTNEKYAFAFSQQSTELLDVFNQGLQAVIEDGTYEEIFAEYFPDVEVPEEFQAAA